MIIVQLSKADFEYDIHSLVKAFFPSENVSVSAEKKEPTERVSAYAHVSMEEKEIVLSWWDLKEVCFPRELPALQEIESFIASKEPNETERIVLETAERPFIKNDLKRGIYRMLRRQTGRELPWGTLTGIRPTRIAMQMIEQGKDDATIASAMKENYLTSDEKIDLAIDIARREKDVLSGLNYKDGYSLYVGIPFCPSTCLYCSFTSYPLAAWEKRVDDYLDALEKELEFVKEIYGHKECNSIYIGGGTPTTLSAKQLDRLLTMIEKRFDRSKLLEFTLEAGRPDSITREKLLAVRDHAVDRISVNPQTMKDETLRVIGRHHTVAQTIESFELARSLGFDNINMDLILGLPGETIDDVAMTVEKIRELSPDNLTVHSLALKRSARLNICRDQYKDYRMEITPEHQRLTAQCARDLGMNPYYMYRQKNMTGNYENVGYGRPGKEGIYNILIMEEVQTIVACGAGTVTKRVYQGDGGSGSSGRIERCDNVKDVTLYMEKLDEMIERKRRLLCQ
ncbi:MAG: coproporphyrinogen dehydrogenase HemZ [bacterium]|nr:coproporphyrinogen dehydrogenase HemZ [bacterium]